MIRVELIGQPERFDAPTERRALRLCREFWRSFGHGTARVLVTNLETAEYHGQWMRY